MSRLFFVPVVVVAVGASILVSAAPESAVRAKPAANVPRELLEQRLEAARNVFRQNLQRLQGREAVCDDAFLAWSKHWLDAELALTDKPAERIAALKAHVERMKELEKIATVYAKTGQGRESDAQAATYSRLDAEIRLLEAAPQ